MKKLINILIYCISATSISDFCMAQSCNNVVDFNFTPSKAGQGVNWEQFPEFSLPFTVIYAGPTQLYRSQSILKRGFSHISNPLNLSNIEPQKRAYIQTNIVSALPEQPWRTESNPWGNNMDVYKRFWDFLISLQREDLGSKTGPLKVDLFMFDIERQLKTNADILKLKSSRFTPTAVAMFDDESFILAYKKELQKMYALSLKYFVDAGVLDSTVNKISSYSDAPILNTFINLQGRTWNQWKTDKSSINYLTYDFDNQKVGGEVYKAQSYLTPSSYFYYDYPHPFAGEYLSYLLFQIEANRIYSKKDQILLLWEKYSYNPDFILKPIKPWMAESMVMFPFFAGAKGIWIWDNQIDNLPTGNYSNYEYMMLGLYRLSKYKEMFEGDFERIETISGRDYNENKQPIWRGIKKGQKMLVVAHNPWAKNENETKEVQIRYGTWSTTITLKGYETFLCNFDIIEEEFAANFFPNPASDLLTIEFKVNTNSKSEMKIHSLEGKLMYSEILDLKKGFVKKELKTANWPSAVYLVSLKVDGRENTRKIVKN